MRRTAVTAGVLVVLASALAAGIALGRTQPSPGALNPADTTIGRAHDFPAASLPDTAPSPTTTVPLTALAPSSSSAPATARYAFPVAPAAKASYGRSHHDYPAADLFAPCGTSVVAPTSGTLTELRRVDAWSSKNDSGATRGGLSFTLVGDDGVRYYGSHLQSIDSSLAVGTGVDPGRKIGEVGRSGNAVGTPCHLHFGISPPCPHREWQVRRGTVYPQPFLDAWRTGGSASPAADVRGWAADHPSACAAASALPDAGAS